MGGVGSGRRDSKPRRRSGAAGAREWLRALCSDPGRRAKVQAALDKALDEGNLGPWWTAFAQGHGNPPQALDVRHGNLDGPIVVEMQFADGRPASDLTLPTSSTLPGTPDPGHES